MELQFALKGEEEQLIAVGCCLCVRVWAAARRAHTFRVTVLRISLWTAISQNDLVQPCHHSLDSALSAAADSPLPSAIVLAPLLHFGGVLALLS
jgi:hypothetical protein